MFGDTHRVRPQPIRLRCSSTGCPDDDDKREAVIGIAEACIIPSLGALANAVFNACGVRVRDLPITPDKILIGLMRERGTA